MIKRHFSKAIENILDLLFPKECLLCQKEGSFLCSDCQELVEFRPVNKCPFCGRFSFLGQTCSSCSKKENIFLAGVFSYSRYNDLLKLVLHAYKYRNIKELEEFLGKRLRVVVENIKKAQSLGRLGRKINWEEALFFYVPLHPWRLRYRGFNQSERLLQKIVDKGLVEQEKQKYAPFLKRRRFTYPQARLEEKERALNIKKAFSYEGPSLENKDVFIIDDVSTSGLTLNECARVLRQAGAKKVYGLVIGRG